VKSIIHKGNLTEISDIAFLCAALGVRDLGYIVLTPTPRLESSGLMPTAREYKEVISYIKGKIIPSFSMEIGIEGYADTELKIPFCNPVRGLSVDHEGNLVFCCNLSHPTAGNGPDEFGKEFLGNIKEIGIEEGVIRHYRVFGWFVEKVLKSGREKFPIACAECLELFGKMEWRKRDGSSHNKNY
jgi:MoaA/NifB/PqqE/SkfB family radical SAM enzyme